MLLLAVDTSTLQGGVCLTRDDHLIASLSFNVKLTYSEKLIPLIDNLLKTAGYEVNDLEGFVVAQGPGSFTGLRVGMTTIIGMAHALKKKIAAIPTLDFLSMNALVGDYYVCPMMDARKNEVYTAIYEPALSPYPLTLTPKSEYMACSIQFLIDEVKKDFGNKKTVFLGNGLENYQSFLETALGNKAICLSRPFWKHDVYYLAYLGFLKFQNNQVNEPSNIEPFYVRTHFL